MAEQLFRLGNTQWWVLVDTDLEKIVDQFNKPQLAATIKALENTIAGQPNLTEMQQDYADLVSLVKTQNIPKARKDRVLLMLDNMFIAYEHSPTVIDIIQIRNRLSHLKSFLNQMEV